jgi:hypothetical protein
MKRFEQGLRCQDIHAGLRALDPNSARLSQLDDTRLIGMAATLAATIRGQDVVGDAQALKAVAAEQLDVDSLAFNSVVDVLQEVEFIYSVKQDAGRVISFSESVPYHEDLYAALGNLWARRAPTQVEQELVAMVHRLAGGPVPAESVGSELGLDSADLEELLTISRAADLVKGVVTPNGEILYSPFLAFERPELLGEVLITHGPDILGAELQKVRSYQGLPVSSTTTPALSDAVARGLLLAPSVERPEGQLQPFACLPYSLDSELTTVRKSVLDKALAIVSCVRCGQHFGGYSGITRPLALLDRLLDPTAGFSLRAHSSARRQYQILFRMQVVDFVPSGNWVIPRLIVTDDNVEAVRIARDLIAFGEPLTDRLGNEAETRALLMNNRPYLSPMQTVQRRRTPLKLSDAQFEHAMDALMGRAAL